MIVKAQMGIMEWDGKQEVKYPDLESRNQNDGKVSYPAWIQVTSLNHVDFVIQLSSSNSSACFLHGNFAKYGNLYMLPKTCWQNDFCCHLLPMIFGDVFGSAFFHQVFWDFQDPTSRVRFWAPESLLVPQPSQAQRGWAFPAARLDKSEVVSNNKNHRWIPIAYFAWGQNHPSQPCFSHTSMRAARIGSLGRCGDQFRVWLSRGGVTWGGRERGKINGEIIISEKVTHFGDQVMNSGGESLSQIQELESWVYSDICQGVEIQHVNTPTTARLKKPQVWSFCKTGPMMVVHRLRPRNPWIQKPPIHHIHISDMIYNMYLDVSCIYIYYICTVDVSKWSNKSHFERFPPILNGSKKNWPPLSKELQPNFEGSPGSQEGWIHLCPLTVILQLLSVQHANDFNTLGFWESRISGGEKWFNA